MEFLQSNSISLRICTQIKFRNKLRKRFTKSFKLHHNLIVIQVQVHNSFNHLPNLFHFIMIKCSTFCNFIEYSLQI